jgi:peptidylprolyl isomerase
MPSSKYRNRRPRKKKSNTKKIIAIVALLTVAVIVSYVMLTNNDTSTKEEEEPELTQMKVLLQTSMGNITIQLRDDMPITTTNFKNLVNDGTYDKTVFHRVVNVPDSLVMIQGGDPNRNGLSDDGIDSIQDEFSDNPENNKNLNGTIAMANLGENYPNSGSSQFFINADYNSHLDNLHPVFGDVIDGMDVVIKILNVETDANNRPVEDVILFKATLIE